MLPLKNRQISKPICSFQTPCVSVNFFAVKMTILKSWHLGFYSFALSYIIMYLSTIKKKKT